MMMAKRARWCGWVLAGAILVIVAGSGRGDDAGGFAAWCAARAAEAGEASVIPGRDGWLFLAAEIRHLGAGKFWGEDAVRAGRAADPAVRDPLPAMLDFHGQLETIGVRLLIVPVPPKGMVYADKLGLEGEGGEAASSPALEEFYALLRERGMNVLDLADAFRREGVASSDTPLYCRTDTHWSGRGCEIAAAEIRRFASEQGWIGAAGETPFVAERRSVEIRGDLQRMLGEEGDPESVALRFVRPGSSGRAPAPDADSPVLLLGDSHVLVFHDGGDMHARGAGLAEQLAMEMGQGVDVLGVRGSGATPARISLMRRTRSNPAYLRGKKVVIWCFGAREFTEADGWRKVPVVR